MADLAMLFTFFGAIVFGGAAFISSQIFKGIPGLLMQAGIGMGLVTTASSVAGFCPALASVLVSGAIVVGGPAAIIALMIFQNVPFIGGAIAGVMEPFTGSLIFLLIISIVHAVLKALGPMELIPVIGIIVLVANVLVPVIILAVLWTPFSDGFAGLPSCIGLSDSSVSGQVPGTGGVSIGTGK
jgi:hypothetical protein